VLQQQWRARVAEGQVAAEAKLASLAAELEAVRAEQRELVQLGNALEQTNSYMEEVQGVCAAVMAEQLAERTPDSAAAGGDTAMPQGGAGAVHLADADVPAGGTLADANGLGGLAQQAVQQHRRRHFAAQLVKTTIDWMVSQLGRLTMGDAFKAEFLMALATPQLVEYGWARMEATTRSMTQLAEEQPWRRGEIEAKLDQGFAVLARCAAVAGRRHPGLVRRITHRPLPPGPPPGSPGYDAAMAAGVPPGINPVLVPTVARMEFSSEQSAALAPDWELYQQRAVTSRQELRAVLVRFAATHQHALGAEELDDMLLGRTASSFLDTLGKVADLQQCIDTERFALYDLYVALLRVMTRRQQRIVFMACRPYQMDALQLCSLLVKPTASY
jgi:hypothetical protein